MKKILLSSALLLGILVVNAQTLVSTKVTKKNVVLEEFTGIHCGYCPAGHKIGEDMSKANPGRVVRVHIHAGSFATPRTGEVDFRTVHGEGVRAHYGATSFPTGTINRTLTNGKYLSSRGAWASIGAQEMAKDAVVNVGSYAEVDKDGKISIDVEAYYTANSSTTTNKLHIAILQNNVPGVQSGSAGNPADVLPGGMYNHKHILREFITGQWGEDITTTRKGDFYKKKFNFQLPSAYKGKSITPLNTKIAVYISESKNVILNGVETAVVLPAAQRADIAFVNKTVIPADWCFKTLTPSLEIANMDDKDLTSCDLTATINGKDYIKSWAGTLKKGEKTVVSWDPITITTQRVLTLDFGMPSNINGGGLFDVIESNNQIAPLVAPVVGDASPSNKLNITFENNGGFYMLNPEGLTVRTLTAANINNWTTPTGAWANSNTSFMWDWVTWGLNKKAEMFFDKLDLSAATAPSLVFHSSAAYELGGTADMTVMVSDDCGKTWKVGKNFAAAELNSSPALPVNYRHFPTSADWKYHSVDLKAYAGKKDVIVKFVSDSKNGKGGTFYLDNVRLSEKAVSVNEISNKLSGVTLYPNPTSGNTNINLTLKTSGNVSVNVLNLAGQKVYSQNNTATSGINTISLKLNNLKAGIYLVKINTTEGTVTKKLNIL